MKKCFNNVQMLEISDVCNKFSKSVSYETLVIGAATTGREYKQIRRLFLSSADKPLSAVGTLTSLLCNSAKVMEKLFYRHSEPKAKNPKKTGTVIIGRGCEPIISAESLYCHARPRSGISAESKRDPRLIATQSPRMTEKVLSFLRLCGAGKKQKESSLILRKAKFQAIFKFVLSSASGGGKYNRISAFVSMPVLLIRSSREFFNSLASYARDSLIFATQKRNDGNMKNRDDRLFLGFAKVLALTFIFTLFATAESQADDVIPTSGTCNSDGTCLWSLGPDGTLTISAEDGAKDVKMANYYCHDNPCDQSSLISRPWEASLQQIKSVVIGDNITYIGNDAFQAATNLTSVTGMKDVKTIGSNGVFAFTGLTSITIPEGVTYIGDQAFSNVKSLTSITIPDNIDTKNWSADVFKYLPKGTNIVCQGDLNTCYEKLAKYIPTDKDGTCTEYCISPSHVIEATDPLQCSGNYGWSGAGCSRKNDDGSVPCASGFVEWDKQCWSEYPFAKKRWTPAEANEWLHDGNDNFVIITFKK